MTGALPYSGSPPLVRGIFSRRQPDTHSGRLTPACAGNIIASAFDDACIQAHPRMRGEYRFNRRYLMQDTGSPPHTRGISRQVETLRSPRRLTPAYAGNINQEQKTITGAWAHPRIRGEYVFDWGIIIRILGSPPHTRGICARSGHEGYDGRLTPAYAGNMMSDEVYVTFEKAHPRIRGEYRFTS